jgi:hypothetical protein
MISGGFVIIISTAQSQFSRWSPVIWSPTTIMSGSAFSFHSLRKSSQAEPAKESCYCVSYQFAVLGRVVGGRVLVHRFGYSN